MRLEKNSRPGAGPLAPNTPVMDLETFARLVLDMADLASIAPGDEYPAHLSPGAFIGASLGVVPAPLSLSGDDPFDSLT